MGSLETSADTEQDAKPTYFESLLLVSAALYVAGRLGLQFSIPPTSTSILWPPTGIALAACLLGGPRMALAVLIGFFLTGLSLSASIPAWLAAVLAGCATIQAVATSVLIRNLIGFPGPVWRGERVPFFLLLSGPIGSTVSATLSISCYVLVGLFPASAFWGHWLTHWTGDTLGALVVMPLCLTLAARPGHAFGGRRLAVALPLAISFLLTGIVFRTALKTSSENAVQEFLRQSKQDLATRLLARGIVLTGQTETVLNSLLVKATEEELDWLRAQPGVMSVGYLPEFW
ncbi:MAG: MASE1 domain-containing protein, partial [Candidatus Wallbacteria bacterium]|nr:MASE1 domain-containing protein [Candidatus Wallbacteria bacterium]